MKIRISKRSIKTIESCDIMMIGARLSTKVYKRKKTEYHSIFYLIYFDVIRTDIHVTARVSIMHDSS